MTEHPGLAGHGRRPPAVIRQALRLMAVLVPLAMAASWFLAEGAGAGQAAFLAGGLCLLGGAAVLWGLRTEFHPHDRLGLANGITLTRAAGIAALAGLLATPLGEAGWTLAVVAAGLLALDGVDGWAARRSGLASRFGARFDMETDVIFALVLALLAWQADKAGLWFVLLGLLRPLYLAAATLWPALRRPLPPSRRRRATAGLQMAGQVAVLAPVLPPPESTVVAGLLLVGVALSFAVDIRWQIRQGRPHP
ncbi:MAG: CDP-alcohol phosphatidyltransferase family protein [Pseudorhodobacter sp.]